MQMPDTELPELPKRKRRGPKRLAALDLRTHTVSVRLNPRELADLDTARHMVQMQRGEYLRDAWMGKLPPTIPPINREAWLSLARVAGNLNQRQRQINDGSQSDYPPEQLTELLQQVQRLRVELIGMHQEQEPKQEAGDES